MLDTFDYSSEEEESHTEVRAPYRGKLYNTTYTHIDNTQYESLRSSLQHYDLNIHEYSIEDTILADIMFFTKLDFPASSSATTLDTLLKLSELFPDMSLQRLIANVLTDLDLGHLYHIGFTVDTSQTFIQWLAYLRFFSVDQFDMFTKAFLAEFEEDLTYIRTIIATPDKFGMLIRLRDGLLPYIHFWNHPSYDIEE